MHTPGFGDIRTAIQRMAREGEGRPGGSASGTSDFWADTLKYLDYIEELSDAQLAFIRIHTAFITGRAWFSYAHHPLRHADDAAKEALPLVQQYRDLTQDLPSRYRLSEPVPNAETGIVGIRWQDKFLTDDLLRYQRTVTNLYNAGLLGADEGARKVVLEIGGGYGALAYHLSSTLPNASCILVDFPKMLFWQAVYLRLNHPQRKMYLYAPDTFGAGIENLVREYDYVLIPDYVIQPGVGFPQLDLALNMLSFQEMREQRVLEYLAFIASHLRGWFYSENFARHVHNRELTCDLYELFARYFDLIPNQRMSDHPALQQNIWCLYAYLGTSKSAPAQLSPIRRELVSDYRVSY